MPDKMCAYSFSMFDMELGNDIDLPQYRADEGGKYPKSWKPFEVIFCI